VQNLVLKLFLNIYNERTVTDIERINMTRKLKASEKQMQIESSAGAKKKNSESLYNSHNHKNTSLTIDEMHNQLIIALENYEINTAHLYKQYAHVKGASGRDAVATYCQRYSESHNGTLPPDNDSILQNLKFPNTIPAPIRMSRLNNVENLRTTFHTLYAHSTSTSTQTSQFENSKKSKTTTPPLSRNHGCANLHHFFEAPAQTEKQTNLHPAEQKETTKEPGSTRKIKRIVDLVNKTSDSDQLPDSFFQECQTLGLVESAHILKTLFPNRNFYMKYMHALQEYRKNFTSPFLIHIFLLVYLLRGSSGIFKLRSSLPAYAPTSQEKIYLLYNYNAFLKNFSYLLTLDISKYSLLNKAAHQELETQFKKDRPELEIDLFREILDCYPHREEKLFLLALVPLNNVKIENKMFGLILELLANSTAHVQPQDTNFQPVIKNFPLKIERLFLDLIPNEKAIQSLSKELLTFFNAQKSTKGEETQINWDNFSPSTSTNKEEEIKKIELPDKSALKF
jgi:hypothetical protein